MPKTVGALAAGRWGRGSSACARAATTGARFSEAMATAALSMIRLMTISVTSSVTVDRVGGDLGDLAGELVLAGQVLVALVDADVVFLTMVLLLRRCVGGFDVGKAAVQVERGGGLGQPGVAGGDRLGDGGVLGGGGAQPRGVVGGQPADAHQVDAQAAHGLGEVGVGDGGVDGRVEPADQLVVVVPGRVLRRRAVPGPASSSRCELPNVAASPRSAASAAALPSRVSRSSKSSSMSSREISVTTTPRPPAVASALPR